MSIPSTWHGWRAADSSPSGSGPLSKPRYRGERGSSYLPAMSVRGTAVNTDGTGRSALLVAAGILLSRIAGLIRDRVFAHYFGNSAAADAFRAAFRIPNLLQNLFGEGVLSASFIPVYARLLAHDDEVEAGRVAGATVALLALVIAALVLVGMLTTPYLIDVIVPGFKGERRDLTVRLVKILFPGAGLLVFSAWCLGILNSHGRFFMSYAAPVLWNAAMIATLIGFGSRMNQFPLAETLAWGCRACGRSCATLGLCSSAAGWYRSAPTSMHCSPVSCRPVPSLLSAMLR